MQARLHRSTPSPFKRGLALFCAGMVMLLSLASMSPELHAWLHKPSPIKAHACSHHSHTTPAPLANDGDLPSEGAHDCAVTLFSHGVVHSAIAIVTQPCEGILRAVNYRAFERLALAQPRYLHLPPQAPPAA